MKKQLFTGPMGKWIKQHLALRRSLGSIYRCAEYELNVFDQHLAKHFPHCQTISREMVISYLDSTRHHKPRTRVEQLNHLRQFCRFMFQLDLNTYIPEKGLLAPAKAQVIPYIFTETDIIKLMEEAKKLRCDYKKTLLPHTYKTIIGLLWTTGMRISEVVHLNVEDVDTINGIIYIQQTKFFKSRLIPLSVSSTQALIAYKKQRADFGYSEKPGTRLFFNNISKPCTPTMTPTVIKELMLRAGLQSIQGKTPRVHDIRHSFATRWFLDFYQSKKDPSAYLPVLATYMGHTKISDTQVYLHPSIELMNIASQKAQSYFISSTEKNHETGK
jgi:integrase/recombinase XerD